MKKGYGSIEDRIKERYHGINDPVASKILSKIKEKPKAPEVPTDPTLTSLFIGGIKQDIDEEELLNKLSQFGKIARHKLLPKHDCGFVCFHSREAAERTMETLHDKLFVGE
jgi:pre-mRNA-splicing factor RBM22/SLT11